MLTIKISELGAINSLADEDILPVVDASDTTTKKVTAAQIRDFLLATLAPGSVVVSGTSFGVEPAVGTSLAYARADHSHGTPPDPMPSHLAALDPHNGYLLANGTRALTGTLSAGTNRITGLGAPTVATDATNKAYVDSKVQGLDWQESVKSRTNDPPASPTAMARYLLNTAPTGDWAGHPNEIATWNGVTWGFDVPNDGWATWIEDVDILRVFNGSAWVTFGSTSDHGALSGLLDDDHTQYFLADGTRDLVGALTVDAISSPDVAPESTGRIYFDSALNRFRVSENGGDYVDLITGGTVTSVVGEAPLSTGGTSAAPTITFPSWPANASGFLSNNGSGMLSWAAPPAASLTVGSTPIAGGANNNVLFQNGGVLQESTQFQFFSGLFGETWLRSTDSRSVILFSYSGAAGGTVGGFPQAGLVGLNFKNAAQNVIFYENSSLDIRSATSSAGYVPFYLSHYDFSFGTLSRTLRSSFSGIVINPDGNNLADFKVVGDNDANLVFVDVSADNFGISTAAPTTKFSVAEKFQVDGNGNIVKINNVTTSFPASQGGAGTVLTNDGSGNLSWSAAATGTVTGSGAATRVAFWDGTSSLSSDANLYWDDTNNRLGIGTSSPLSDIEISSEGSTTNRTSAFGTSVTPGFIGFRGRGTRAAPEAVRTGDTLFQFTGQGIWGSTLGERDSGARITVTAEENWTVLATGAKMVFSTNTIGATSTTQAERLSLSSAGIVVNGAGDNVDFSVKSVGNANMLFVDASANAVGIGMELPVATLDLRGSLLARSVTNSVTAYQFQGIVVADTGTATGTQSSTTLQNTSKVWTINQYAGYTITTTGGTGAGQTRQVVSNTPDTLTVTPNWTTTPVNGSTTYSVSTGSTVLDIDTTNQRVGIGTTSPTYKVEIKNAGGDAFSVNSTSALGAGQGTAWFLADAGADAKAAQIFVANSGSLGEPSRISFRDSTAGITHSAISAERPHPAGGGTMSFSTTSAGDGAMTERMRITSSGNVGIGTASPAYPVDIQAAYPQLALGKTVAGAAGAFRFRDGNGTLRADIGYAAAGSLLLQFTNNNSPIKVASTQNTAGNYVAIETGGPSGDVERVRFKVPADAAEVVFNDAGADYDFRVESDDRTHLLFVDANAGNTGSLGRVGVNNSTPGATLDISNGASAEAALIVRDNTTPVFKIDDGGSVTIGQPGTSYTLPTSRGTIGQVLQTDGSGGVTWAAPPTALTGSGVDNQIAVWSGASSLDGDGSLTWNGSALGIAGALNKTGVGSFSLYTETSSDITVANGKLDVAVTLNRLKQYGYAGLELRTDYLIEARADIVLAAPSGSDPVSADAMSSNTLTDNTQSWGVNALVGQYIEVALALANDGPPEPSGVVVSGVIASNTATEITVTSPWEDFGPVYTYTIHSAQLRVRNVADPDYPQDVATKHSVEEYVAANVTTTAITTYDSDGSIDLNQGTILVDAAAGVVIITLPDAAVCPGQMFVIKKIDTSANKVIVGAYGYNDGDIPDQYIDGSTSYELRNQYEAVKVQSNGTQFWII